MRISGEAMDDFIKIYREEFGEEVDRKEANAMAQRVLTLYDLITRKLPKAPSSTPVSMQPIDDHPSVGFRT